MKTDTKAIKEKKDLVKDWKNIFFDVYGWPIVERYKELYRLKNPNGPEGNTGFEAGMDFQSWIKQFIEGLLKEAVASHNQELIQRINKLPYENRRGLLKPDIRIKRKDVLALLSEDHIVEANKMIDVGHSAKDIDAPTKDHSTEGSIEVDRRSIEKSWRPGDKEDLDVFNNNAERLIKETIKSHKEECRHSCHKPDTEDNPHFEGYWMFGACSHCSPEGEICKHCGQPIKIRMLDPKCDHLYYPENCVVCSKGEIESE